MPLAELRPAVRAPLTPYGANLGEAHLSSGDLHNASSNQLSKAELQLKQGRLPSLSPDEEDLEGPNVNSTKQRREAATDSASVWGQIESKVGAAPRARSIADR